MLKVIEQDDLVDRVFDFAFDVLGLRYVELRIRERTSLKGESQWLRLSDPL
jgi:hypothetical protein